MSSFARLLMLPSSILILLAASSNADNGPSYDQRMAALDDLQDGNLVRRDYDVLKKLALAAPIGVRKMSGDEGEKFYPEYWHFQDDLLSQTSQSRRDTTGNDAYDPLSNLTTALPPYLLHAEPFAQSPLLSWLLPRAALSKRFQCPSQTQNCSSINRPNSCCSLDETCVIVDDTGLGDVGCCPDGEQCGGQVSDCDTGAGYSSCPNSDNGGCCIPNYTCMGIGCVTVGGSTTTTTLPLATVTGSQSSSSRSSSTTPSSADTATVTVTTTLSSGTATPLPPGRPTESTSSSSPSSSSSSSRPSSSATSSSRSAIVTTYTSTQSGGGGDVCPTGFYPCSARYDGGCCRVGRDCQSTSCPIPATQTVVVSNGVTIIAGSGYTPSPPSSGASATTTVTGTSTIQPGGNCATGWFSCAQSDGGGCCPTGYGCGTICTATVSGAQQSTVQKINIGPRVAALSSWSLVTIGIVSFLGMLVL